MKISRSYEKIKETERLKSQFIANMSHELRTPLNAIKFTSQGTIEIDMGVVTQEEILSMKNSPHIYRPTNLPITDDNAFFLSVKDTGIGIKMEDLHSIFAIFSQVDSSSIRKEGGAGLGLPIAAKVLEMHQGELFVESTINSGTTFYIVLPMVKEM